MIMSQRRRTVQELEAVQAQSEAAGQEAERTLKEVGETEKEVMSLIDTLVARRRKNHLATDYAVTIRTRTL